MSDVRKQFTMYESVYKALSRIKKKADRADAYDIICAYALYNKEPDLENVSDAVALAFDLIRPVLDSARKKATSGKKGGSSSEANGKQTASKPQANGKQTASEKEGEIEKEKEKEVEIEKEIEKESYNLSSQNNPDIQTSQRADGAASDDGEKKTEKEISERIRYLETMCRLYKSGALQDAEDYRRWYQELTELKGGA